MKHSVCDIPGYGGYLPRSKDAVSRKEVCVRESPGYQWEGKEEIWVGKWEVSGPGRSLHRKLLKKRGEWGRGRHPPTLLSSPHPDFVMSETWKRGSVPVFRSAELELSQNDLAELLQCSDLLHLWNITFLHHHHHPFFFCISILGGQEWTSVMLQVWVGLQKFGYLGTSASQKWLGQGSWKLLQIIDIWETFLKVFFPLWDFVPLYGTAAPSSFPDCGARKTCTSENRVSFLTDSLLPVFPSCLVILLT